MTATANGVALHGGFMPYVATFLVFTDYARNAIRMSALMRQRVDATYSPTIRIALGEDGPTHQPVEHLGIAAADPEPRGVAPHAMRVETAAAWAEALSTADGPTAARSVAPGFAAASRGRREQMRRDQRGGYVLVETGAAGGDAHSRPALRSQLAMAPAPNPGERKRPAARGLDAVRRPLRGAGCGYGASGAAAEPAVITLEAGATARLARYAEPRAVLPLVWIASANPATGKALLDAFWFHAGAHVAAVANPRVLLGKSETFQTIWS